MCSIMGYCDVCTDIAAFTDGFMETVSRGPDDSRIVDTGHGLLGFHRLAIMGLTPEGMQPFELVRFEQRSCRGSIESSTGRPEQQVRDTYGREPAPVRSRLHH